MKQKVIPYLLMVVSSLALTSLVESSSELTPKWYSSPASPSFKPYNFNGINYRNFYNNGFQDPAQPASSSSSRYSQAEPTPQPVEDLVVPEDTPDQVIGSYDYRDSKGRLHIVNYVNDVQGLRVLNDYTPYDSYVEPSEKVAESRERTSNRQSKETKFDDDSDWDELEIIDSQQNKRKDAETSDNKHVQWDEDNIINRMKGGDRPQAISRNAANLLMSISRTIPLPQPFTFPSDPRQPSYFLRKLFQPDSDRNKWHPTVLTPLYEADNVAAPAPAKKYPSHREKLSYSPASSLSDSVKQESGQPFTSNDSNIPPAPSRSELASGPETQSAKNNNNNGGDFNENSNDFPEHQPQMDLLVKLNANLPLPQPFLAATSFPSFPAFFSRRDSYQAHRLKSRWTPSPAPTRLAVVYKHF